MIRFLFLFFNIFSLSFQTVQAALFCDDDLKEVYVVEGNIEIKIADGVNGAWNKPFIYPSLNATPGDLIKMKCYNKKGGASGAGCFLVNNECLCYMFNNSDGKEYNYSKHNRRIFNFNSKNCDIIIYMLKEMEIQEYYFQNYIPLDANCIFCQNETNVLIIPYDKNHYLKLSEYIYADFDIKNVEVSITENYGYFSLEGVKLEENNRFNILNELIFNSKDKGKISVKFTNHGKILNTTKDCQFYIRICHERCKDCFDKNIDENHHQCKKCRDEFYPVEKTHNCKRKEEIDWTKYYFNETENMFKRCYKNCKTNLEENFENYFINGDFNTSDIENGKNKVIEFKDMIMTFTSTKNQKDDKININKTTVNLGECENILRKKYNISENETIFMIKIDAFQEGMRIPKIVYDVYSRLDGINLTKLNLSFCANVKIDISIPIIITENIDKLNISSDYYKDICYTATSDSGTDINLNDRKNEFIEKNLTICQENCIFSDYDYNTKIAKCSCNMIESISSLKDIKIDKSKLFENFINIKNIANINILVCYKVLFSKEGIKNNYGCFFMIFIFLWHYILMILFFAKFQYKKIIQVIKDIEFAIINNKLLIEERKRMKMQKRLAKKGEEDKDKEIKQTKKENQINKRQKNKSNKEKEQEKEIIIPINNLNHKKRKKRHIKLKNEININNIDNNIKKVIQTDIFESKKKISLTNKIDEEVLKKAEKIMQYNYDEINDLPYKKAKRRDKRTYCLYYLSLLKTNHDIIFTFFYKADYNSKIIKIDLFLISFTLYFSVNILFFNDETMHTIYENKGSFDLMDQLPQIIYSTLISTVLKFILNILALTEGLILKFRSDKTANDLENRIKSLKKHIKIKFTFYFIVSTILLLVFWYYVSMFCAIYKNTQIHLIKDTLISYILSLISPFWFYLIPGIFRIPSLSKRKKNRVCFYNISKILQAL